MEAPNHNATSNTADGQAAPELDDWRIKKRVDVLENEIKALDTQENWGTTLLLTAIALLTKQLVDWSSPGEKGVPAVVAQAPWLYLVPASLGVVAFIFLRVVNHRLRDVRYRVFEVLDPARVGAPRANGSVGWMMALLPLTLGVFCSWVLAPQGSSRTPLFWVGAAVVCAVVVCARVIFVRRVEADASGRRR